MNEQLVDLNEEYNSSCNGCGEIGLTFSEGLCRYCYEVYVADLAERDDAFFFPAMEDEEEIDFRDELLGLSAIPLHYSVEDCLDIETDIFSISAIY